jgi:hypothetical protein
LHIVHQQDVARHGVLDAAFQMKSSGIGCALSPIPMNLTTRPPRSEQRTAGNAEFVRRRARNRLGVINSAPKPSNPVNRHPSHQFWLRKPTCVNRIARLLSQLATKMMSHTEPRSALDGWHPLRQRRGVSSESNDRLVERATPTTLTTASFARLKSKECRATLDTGIIHAIAMPPDLLGKERCFWHSMTKERCVESTQKEKPSSLARVTPRM